MIWFMKMSALCHLPIVYQITKLKFRKFRKTHRQKKGQRCKRQKPFDNPRNSVVNIPAPESDHLRLQSSLAGAQLRSKRRRLDEGCEYNTSVIAVAALSAASVTNSILNKNKKTNLQKKSLNLLVLHPLFQ